jgi:hypothetical protein
MRRRITKALVTTVAAGASIATLGLTAAGSAGAAVAHPAKVHQQGSLPLISTTNTGGYEASGRDFRYVTSLIRVPDMPQNGLYPQTYIELSNGSAVGGGDTSGDTDVKAGIETCLVAEAQNPNFTCDPGVEWVGFVEAFNNSINSPFFTHFVPLNVVQGDGVGFSIYFDQAGNELHFVLTPPTAESCSTGPANECTFKTQAFGPVYDHASGLLDYTNSTGQPVPLPIFGTHFRVTQFLQGALTTYSGDRGSWTGPWTTSEVEATSNGLPYPQGSVRLSPSPLWSDGVSVNGAVRGDDAFGVWRRVG